MRRMGVNVDAIKFALMRGRELKYRRAAVAEDIRRSPSCEGGS